MARRRNVRRTARTAFLAGLALLWPAFAAAQLASPYDNPMTPMPDNDPRKPQRFQQQKRTPQQTGQPETFKLDTPSGSGAGNTGFDSTNARKKKAAEKPKARNAPNQQAIAPGVPAQRTTSPYQKPPKTNANAAMAQAPGNIPVELGPIRRFPKKRKAHEEPPDPYAPVGIHSGGLIYYPAIEFAAGHDSNPGRYANGPGASLYSIAPELKVQSIWSRHELKADLRGSYTGYSPDQTPALSRPYFNGNVDGRVDVTHDTRIDLNGRMLVSTDNPNSPNLQAGLSKLPIFYNYGGNVGVGQKFNRLDLSAKADFERTIYQASSLVDGTTASNDDRNYDQYMGKFRAGYELNPGVKPYVEADIDTRRHDLKTDFSGYMRDSNGLTGKLGSTFEISKLLTGDVSVGYTQRKYEDARLEKLTGLVGDASLVWTPTALTTVKFTARSTVGETVTPGVSGALYRDAGIQIDHAFRRWLIGTVKLGIGQDNYVGLDRTDRRYSAGVGLTYKLSQTVQIKGEVRQDWLHSNVSGVDYTATAFLVGLRLQR